jgi:deazaflavin-dependent oxidoreductase (nitroreductase family)
LTEHDRNAIEKEAARSVRLDRGPFRRLSRRMHVGAYRLTGGRLGGRLDSASGVRPILLLTTTGNRSGKRRTTPIVFLEPGDGTYVVAASNAGRASDPGWINNLRACPEAEIRIGRGVIRVTATELTREEADQLWPALDAMNAQYAEYRKLTERPVPVVRLTPHAI